MDGECPKSVAASVSIEARKTYTVFISDQEVADPGEHRDLVAEVTRFCTS
jgi:sigma54-dependent transcription regulator